MRLRPRPFWIGGAALALVWGACVATLLLPWVAERATLVLVVTSVGLVAARLALLSLALAAAVALWQRARSRPGRGAG